MQAIKGLLKIVVIAVLVAAVLSILNRSNHLSATPKEQSGKRTQHSSSVISRPKVIDPRVFTLPITAFPAGSHLSDQRVEKTSDDYASNPSPLNQNSDQYLKLRAYGSLYEYATLPSSATYPEKNGIEYSVTVFPSTVAAQRALRSDADNVASIMKDPTYSPCNRQPTLHLPVVATIYTESWQKGSLADPGSSMTIFAQDGNVEFAVYGGATGSNPTATCAIAEHSASILAINLARRVRHVLTHAGK